MLSWDVKIIKCVSGKREQNACSSWKHHVLLQWVCLKFQWVIQTHSLYMMDGFISSGMDLDWNIYACKPPERLLMLMKNLLPHLQQSWIIVCVHKLKLHSYFEFSHFKINLLPSGFLHLSHWYLWTCAMRYTTFIDESNSLCPTSLLSLPKFIKILNIVKEIFFIPYLNVLLHRSAVTLLASSIFPFFSVTTAFM